MPSQKTAEKAVEKKEALIEVIAVRKFGAAYTKDELKEMQAKDKDKRSFEGMTRIIEVGETAFVSKDSANKLQDAGAIKVAL